MIVKRKLSYTLSFFCLLLISSSCNKEIPKSIPSIETAVVMEITSISAKSGGNITSDGGAALIVRGVCWGINPNPSISDNKTLDGAVPGSFTSYIVGLSPGNSYYVRAYATNSIGTAYGNQLTFTTLAVVPTITTNAVYSITQTSATVEGNITSDGGASVTERGVCWSTHQNPTIFNTKTSNGLGIGNYFSFLEGLTPGTTYYVRAYATNAIGTSYGNQVTFNTFIAN